MFLDSGALDAHIDTPIDTPIDPLTLPLTLPMTFALGAAFMLPQSGVLDAHIGILALGGGCCVLAQQACQCHATHNDRT